VIDRLQRVLAARCPTVERETVRCAVAGLMGLALASCASPAAPRRAPRAPETARKPAVSRWASMSWDRKHDVMTFLVLPNMARVFQRFEKKPYPDMTCRTCHGADAERIDYSMPNDLPALDPGRLPRKSAVARFMWQSVTPKMADMLDDPAGFSCFSCHPSAR
jgi:hypothetical protein